MKNKALLLGAISSIIVPTSVVVSCNVRVGREQKDNTIPDKELLESITAKKLLTLISDKFELEFSDNLWKNNIFDKKTTWDPATQQFVAQTGIEFDNSKDIADVVRNASSTFEQPYRRISAIEWQIWRNTFYDQDVQSLLNNIKTVYNRKKMVYPTNSSLTNENNIQKANLTYEVDLVTPMKRRFMKRYQQINTEIPNSLATTNAIWDRMNIDKPLEDRKTIYGVLDQYFWSVTNNRAVKPDWFLDAKYMNKEIIDWSKLIFKQQPNKKYKIQYAKHTVTGIDSNTGNLVETESPELFAKEFDKSDSLQDVATYIEEQMFTNNANAYMKSLFTDPKGLEGRIEFASLAGTSINGTTVEDYTTNLLPDSGISLGHFNIYIRNKKTKTKNVENINPISWYRTDVNMGKG